MDVNLKQVWEVGLLALCLWREARNQPADAITAVACSIRNRTLKPAWWNSMHAMDYIEVILHPEQYSSFNAGDVNAAKMPLSSDLIFPQCLEIAQSIWDGTQSDTIQGAQSYFDRSLDSNPPQWANTQTHICDVGDFHFYRA